MAAKEGSPLELTRSGSRLLRLSKEAGMALVAFGAERRLRG